MDAQSFWTCWVTAGRTEQIRSWATRLQQLCGCYPSYPYTAWISPWDSSWSLKMCLCQRTEAGSAYPGSGKSAGEVGRVKVGVQLCCRLQLNSTASCVQHSRLQRVCADINLPFITFIMLIFNCCKHFIFYFPPPPPPPSILLWKHGTGQVHQICLLQKQKQLNNTSFVRNKYQHVSCICYSCK